MLAVSEKDLTKLLLSLDHTQCHDLLRNLSTALAAFSAQRKFSRGENDNNIHQPPRTSIISKKWSSTTLFMPVSDHESTGFKVVTVPKVSTPSNGIRGVINILAPDGRLEGVMSAAEITAFRTALASMVLFTRVFHSLGPSGGVQQKKILIFGSGKQAEWHARLALLSVPEPTDIGAMTFVNRGQQRLEESIRSTLVPDLRARYPHLEINAYSREKLQDTTETSNAYETRLCADLVSSDAIFCCTPSTEPLFTFDDLTPDRRRYISLIGSYKPHMQEIDSQTLLSAAKGMIYVDSVEACLEEAGELIKAKVEEKQLIELGELDETSSALEGQGNVVFKCVGMGIMDLVIARSLLEMAKEQGLGTAVEGF